MICRSALHLCRLVCVAFALHATLALAQPPFDRDTVEAARRAQDTAYRALLAAHLDPAYHHDFAPIDPAWRVEKQWLKPYLGSYALLDFAKYPNPEPDWHVSLTYYIDKERTKEIWLTQQGQIITELDTPPGKYYFRCWATDNTLKQYDVRLAEKFVASLNRSMLDQSVSTIQHGRGTTNRYSRSGHLVHIQYVWDGRIFCTETPGKEGTRPDVSFTIPDISFRRNGETETLWLDKGHEYWICKGEKVSYQPLIFVDNSETGESSTRPPEEISDVPHPFVSPRSYNGRFDEIWARLYPERRAAALQQIRAFLQSIDQEPLLDRTVPPE